MLTPSRTALRRGAQQSSTCSIPAAPKPAWKVVSSVRDLKCVSRLGDRADLLQVRIGQDRLAHFEPLGAGQPCEVEQVRPRPDDRDEAHHELLADRIDRRVRHLREILLEVGEEQLRPVRQRRDRRVGAHRARASSPVAAIGVIRMLMSSCV